MKNGYGRHQNSHPKNWIEVDFYGAMKIKQNAYVDYGFCEKYKDHKWVVGVNSRSGFIWVCHECNNARKEAFKKSSLKTNGVNDVRSKAIRDAEKLNEELALKKFDDYEFDLDD